jgi:phosphodiesterase/alkaline phosphatase D-like protein
MIVLNSNYLYTPKANLIKEIGGNAHGYIMDNQLEWLKNELKRFEDDKNIDHVFVTIHTPAFPNGGHSNNDMWYKGNNIIRPYIAGKAAEKGILERRDEFIDLLVNKSTKFRVLLTGDEHNYSRLTVTNETDIYPQGFEGKRLKLTVLSCRLLTARREHPITARKIYRGHHRLINLPHNMPWCFFILRVKALR